VVDATDRNCTYGGTFSINCKEFPIFYNNNIKHFRKKNLTHSSNYAEHVSALILYLVHVFYTLKHGLSEMVEIVTSVHTMCKQLSCGAEENPDHFD
jgi:hypothetical protein